MLSRSHKFIFIHIPKCGGTSILRVLLDCSEDSTWTAPYQDGVNSFEIRGPVTVQKHDSLQHYRDSLGEAFDDYRIIASVRHPFSRIVSAIFSPHKWARQTETGAWYSEVPYWDEHLLDEILQAENLRPAIDFLRLDGKPIRPDFLIRAESLEADLTETCQRIGLPVPKYVPHVNRSAASPRLRDQVLGNPELQGRIESIYAEDMRFFGYSPYQGR